MKSYFKFILALLLLPDALWSQTQSAIPLYPEEMPNSKPAPADYQEKNGNGWVTRVSQPDLTPVFPAPGKANGAAVIVIPGGAYIGLATHHEGIDVARKFAEAGVTAFLLKYRIPDDRVMVNRSIGPVQDAQRAIQMIRQRASEWQLDPGRIGVIGFSAGGHLASTLGTHYNHSYIENGKNSSLRPDFMILVYPVISMGEHTHQGSKENLIGRDADTQQVELFSNEKQVKKDTPPAFLVHAQDDTVVPVQNSLNFYQELVNKGIKAEMYLYQQGGHGFGLNNKAQKAPWFDLCLNWLQINKFLQVK